MRPQFGPFLLMLTLLSGPLVWSQTGAGDASPSGSPGSPQQSPQGPQPVFTYPEERPPLALLDEVTSHSYFNVGLGVSTAWDSNAASFSYRPYSETYFIFNPSLQIKQTRPTFTWFVGAYGGLTTSNNASYYSTANPSANGGFLWQISKHWQFNVHDNYFYSSDPFRQYLTLSSAPTYNQPNPTTYTQLATTQGNYGIASLTYQINARDSLTFTGTESFWRYLHTTPCVIQRLYLRGSGGLSTFVLRPVLGWGGV